MKTEHPYVEGIPSYFYFWIIYFGIKRPLLKSLHIHFLHSEMLCPNEGSYKFYVL